MQLLSATTFLGAVFCFSAFCFKNMYAFLALFAIGELLVFSTQVLFLFYIFQTVFCPLGISLHNFFLSTPGTCKLHKSSLCKTQHEANIHSNSNCLDSHLWRRPICTTCWSSPGLFQSQT